MSSTAKGRQISTKPGHRQHKKAPPRPPLSKDEQIKRLVGSLCSQLDGEHFENAIKTCNKLLTLDPDDQDAWQTKLWLLFKTNAYTQALDVTQSRPNEFGFERAYALYRLQREGEAADVLDGLGEPHRAPTLLQAQILYRQGAFAACLERYNRLLESPTLTQEEYEDIQVNIQAAETQVAFLTTGFLTAVHQLPPLPNRQTLEDAPLPSLQPVLPQYAVRVTSTEPIESPKPKAPRKSRIPKGVIPGVTPPPDPERWIKKSERTRVGTVGKKKKSGGATQGATVSDAKPSGGGGGKNKKKK